MCFVLIIIIIRFFFSFFKILLRRVINVMKSLAHLFTNSRFWDHFFVSGTRGTPSTPAKQSQPTSTAVLALKGRPRCVCQAFELLLFFLIAFLLPGRSRTFSFHNYFLKHTALRGPRHRSFADAPVRQASRHATEASSCAGARTPSGAHSGGGVRSSSGAAPQHAANQRPTA